MIIKFKKISTEFVYRLFYFFFIYFKIFFSFRIAEKRVISRRQISKVLKKNFYNYKVAETKKTISPIWMNILSKHRTNTLINIEKTQINDLQKTYMNFIDSDLCFGVEDKINHKIGFGNLKSSLRFTREFFRYVTSKSLYPIFNFYQPNRNFLNKIIQLETKLKKVLKNNLHNFNTKIYNTYNINGFRIPSDYFDHIYFVEFIDNLIDNKNLKFLEIGGGSGLLSSLMINNGYSKSIHIDIAPYLLAQNLFLNPDSEYYLSERISKLNKVEADFLINQDSFPEISERELKKIFKLIKASNIKKIFSNNHVSDNQSQTDFRSILKKFNYKKKISLPNPIRKGYLIELYEI